MHLPDLSLQATALNIQSCPLNSHEKYNVHVALLASLVSATAGMACSLEIVWQPSVRASLNWQPCKDGCQPTMCAAIVFACLGGWSRVRVFCHGCVHLRSSCCRGFVDAYRDWLELHVVWEASNVWLGRQCEGIYGYLWGNSLLAKALTTYIYLCIGSL